MTKPISLPAISLPAISLPAASILWFRQDLRLGDNPALLCAVERGEILPIFILDEESENFRKNGAASRWWLHHSLEKLNDSLAGKLNFYQGKTSEILANLVKKFGATGLFWNRCYEPFRIEEDKKIKVWAKEIGIEVKSFNGSLLWEPWEVLKSDNSPYKIFTHFYRKGCLSKPSPRIPLPKPSNIKAIKDSKGSRSLVELNLLPKISWDLEMKKLWQIGEEAALERLKNFTAEGLKNYKIGRNFPSKPNVSRLSAHLHFGEISPNQAWHFCINDFSLAKQEISNNQNLDTFLSELGWREFSYYLLFHFPTLPTKNFQPRFDKFAWKANSSALRSWQKGETGIPIVDAAMRELWRTGYMHNRSRMIVGSFLIKNLLIDWREGEKWFWDCLIDADLASNAASWQWVAGSGADAAPYFRIFNPILQAEKFDPEGEYIRHYVPELKNLAAPFIFAPWKAPDSVLKQAGVELGKNYPLPIIDLEKSRNEALQAFKELPSVKIDEKLH